MSSSSETGDKQLAVRIAASPSIIRTNIDLLSSIEIYRPDDNNSVPYAFMLGMHVFKNASGCKKALLSGYFSVLCAVLPDLKNTACEILDSLGYLVKEIMVPSQKDVKYATLAQPPSNRVEILSFAQLTYIPLINCFEGVRPFWEHVAQKVKIPLHLFCESDVKTLLLALKLSKLRGKLATEVCLSQRALSATSSPFGFVFSEASNRRIIERDRERGSYGYRMTYVWL